MASQWQRCQNAVALQEHTDLAVDLLLGPIDRIGPLGQLPDMYDDFQCESLMVKPPMHGWAVLEIMKRQDLLKSCSRERLEKLYDGMAVADWFMTYRDEDEDGLPSLWHAMRQPLTTAHSGKASSENDAGHSLIFISCMKPQVNARLLNKPEMRQPHGLINRKSF
jgi:hypothetical protein